MFKEMLVKLAKRAIEEAPALIAKAAAQSAKQQAALHKKNSMSGHYTDDGELRIGGLTLDQWDKKWIRLGNLNNLTLDNLKAFNKSIGLYKAEQYGTVKYIGRAIEYNNGGFRKRLRDYVRPSDSGRTHQSGQYMNVNADNLDIYILIVGDSAAQVATVKELERAMIQRYGNGFNIWNVQRN